LFRANTRRTPHKTTRQGRLEISRGAAQTGRGEGCTPYVAMWRVCTAWMQRELSTIPSLVKDDSSPSPYLRLCPLGVADNFPAAGSKHVESRSCISLEFAGVAENAVRSKMLPGSAPAPCLEKLRAAVGACSRLLSVPDGQPRWADANRVLKQTCALLLTGGHARCHHAPGRETYGSCNRLAVGFYGAVRTRAPSANEAAILTIHHGQPSPSDSAHTPHSSLLRR
jgi:hypothetical protein